MAGKMKGASYVRSTLFNIAFYAEHVVLVFGMALCVKLPQRYMVDMLEFTMRCFAWLERNILGLKYEVTGLEHLPKDECYILASKHQSIWETYKLHLWMRNPAVVMKKELVDMPFWGAVARKVDSIGVDRGAGAAALKSLIRGARIAKEQKRAIVIFPQGTRLPAEDYRPYKFGIAALYESIKVPVVPVALNSGMYWPRASFLKRGGTIKVEILPPIPAGMKGAEMLTQLEATLEPATKKLVSEAKADLQI